MLLCATDRILLVLGINPKVNKIYLSFTSTVSTMFSIDPQAFFFCKDSFESRPPL